MTFDTEKFIKEIEIRKAIWDPSIEEYANRDCRRRLWDEVTCSMFNNKIPEDERRDISKLLQQKWKNIRTSFSRELRRRAGKSGLTSCRKNPYIYFDNLTFLWTTVKSNRAHENVDTGQEQNDAGENLVYCQSTSPPPQKIRTDHRDNDLDQVLNRCTAMIERSAKKRRLDLETDSDKLFILSLLDDFRNIPEKRKLTAKLEIIKIIQWAQTSQETLGVPPERNPSSDHDYVRGCNKTFNHSTQTSSPNMQRSLIHRRFLASDSDLSNNSEEELEVIEEDPNSYES